jgi:hypothetical protein
MTETEKLEAAVAVLRRMRDNRAGTGNTAIATERRALDTVLAAITAWNTRPDEGEPVAWLGTTADGWSDVTPDADNIAVWRGYGRHVQPLYTRPAPALEREGVARALRETVMPKSVRITQYAGHVYDFGSLPGITDEIVGLLADAILAMVGGGAPAGWRSVETLAAYEGEFFIALLEDYPEVWATSLYHEAMGRRPSRMAPGARKAMADNASLIVAWMPLPDAPASTVEG